MTHSGDGVYSYCNRTVPSYNTIEVDASGKWRNHKVETPIVVLAKPPSSGTQRITKCCCIPLGNVTFAASISDTRVGRGEVVNVDFGCKNEARTESLDVDAYVSEKIQWNAKGHRNKTKDKKQDW